MDDPTNPTIVEMLAALDESEAQIDAGDVLPLGEVLAEMQAELERWRLDHSPEPRRGLRM